MLSKDYFSLLPADAFQGLLASSYQYSDYFDRVEQRLSNQTAAVRANYALMGWWGCGLSFSPIAVKPDKSVGWFSYQRKKKVGWRALKTEPSLADYDVDHYLGLISSVEGALNMTRSRNGSPYLYRKIKDGFDMANQQQEGKFDIGGLSSIVLKRSDGLYEDPQDMDIKVSKVLSHNSSAYWDYIQGPTTNPTVIISTAKYIRPDLLFDKQSCRLELSFRPTTWEIETARLVVSRRPLGLELGDIKPYSLKSAPIVGFRSLIRLANSDGTFAVTQAEDKIQKGSWGITDGFKDYRKNLYNQWFGRSNIRKITRTSLQSDLSFDFSTPGPWGDLQLPAGGANIIISSLPWLSTPYKQITPAVIGDGIDCSSLTQYLADAVFSAQIPRDSVSQYRLIEGQRPSLANALRRPGTLLFWANNEDRGPDTPGHVGMVVGDGYIIHTSPSTAPIDGGAVALALMNSDGTYQKVSIGTQQSCWLPAASTYLGAIYPDSFDNVIDGGDYRPSNRGSIAGGLLILNKKAIGVGGGERELSSASFLKSIRNREIVRLNDFFFWRADSDPVFSSGSIPKLARELALIYGVTAVNRRDDPFSESISGAMVADVAALLDSVVRMLSYGARITNPPVEDAYDELFYDWLHAIPGAGFMGLIDPVEVGSILSSILKIVAESCLLPANFFLSVGSTRSENEGSLLNNILQQEDGDSRAINRQLAGYMRLTKQKFLKYEKRYLTIPSGQTVCFEAPFMLIESYNTGNSGSTNLSWEPISDVYFADRGILSRKSLGKGESNFFQSARMELCQAIARYSGNNKALEANYLRSSEFFGLRIFKYIDPLCSFLNLSKPPPKTWLSEINRLSFLWPFNGKYRILRIERIVNLGLALAYTQEVDADWIQNMYPTASDPRKLRN